MSVGLGHETPANAPLETTSRASFVFESSASDTWIMPTPALGRARVRRAAARPRVGLRRCAARLERCARRPRCSRRRGTSPRRRLGRDRRHVRLAFDGLPSPRRSSTEASRSIAMHQPGLEPGPTAFTAVPLTDQGTGALASGRRRDRVLGRGCDGGAARRPPAQPCGWSSAAAKSRTRDVALGERRWRA